jgi:transposase
MTKDTSKVVAKSLKDNEVKVLEWPSQSPHHNPNENVWAQLKKHVQARRTTNRTQLHQLCQEEWAKCIQFIVGSLWKATQVKQFKGNATKYTK